MFLTHAAQLLCDALLALAYPQACAICGRSVEQRKFGVACEACWKETPIFTGDEAEFREEVRCRRCDSQSFAVARAAGLYRGALRESVLLLKRQPYVSQHVEDLLVAAARRTPLHRSTRIVPVPLHSERRRVRGFNQASVIAHVLSKRLQLPVDEVSLARVSTSKYRAGLDTKGRRDTVAGAFEVRHPRLVANEDILLVDDVFTTGATVSSCSETLTAAGARNVYVLTIARA
jgi:ComF family protein